MDQSPEDRVAQWKEVFRKFSDREPGWEDAVLDMVMDDFTANRMPRLMRASMSRREHASAQVFLFTRGKLGQPYNSQYQLYLKRQWRKRLTPRNERILTGCEYVAYTLGTLASQAVGVTHASLVEASTHSPCAEARLIFKGMLMD